MADKISPPFFAAASSCIRSTDAYALPGRQVPPCYFPKLHFIVKSHQLHPLAGRVSDQGDLLAGTGANDPLWWNSSTLHQVHFCLGGDIQRRSSELGAGANGGHTRPALTPKSLPPVKPSWGEAIVKGSSHHKTLTLRGQESRKPTVGLRAKCPRNSAFLPRCSHCTCFLVASPVACSALLSTQEWQMWALNKWDKCDIHLTTMTKR